MSAVRSLKINNKLKVFGVDLEYFALLKNCPTLFLVDTFQQPLYQLFDRKKILKKKDSNPFSYPISDHEWADQFW